MSKYNHSKSIPIESIPKRKIKRAIKEWAEGDSSMEELLWTCYEKGIETSGCHAGSYPYIEFLYQDKISCLFDETEKILGSQILILVDGGNPFSGPNWDLSTINFGFDTEYKEEADNFFDTLRDALNNNLNTEKNPLLELLEFFINKESGLLFRFRYTKDNKYEFYIESRFISEKRYKYYNDIFTKAGLKENIDEEHKDSPRHEWIIESDKLDDIKNKIKSSSKYIINNYSLEPEENEEEIEDFNTLARFMKRKMTEKEFQKWLKQKRKEMFRR